MRREKLRRRRRLDVVVRALEVSRAADDPAVFGNPLTPDEAEANVESLLALPHARLLGEKEGFWAAYRDVTRGLAVRGNDVPDAWLAALLRQHDVVTLYTNDRGFRKYGFLKVRSPFDEHAAAP